LLSNVNLTSRAFSFHEKKNSCIRVFKKTDFHENHRHRKSKGRIGQVNGYGDLAVAAEQAGDGPVLMAETLTLSTRRSTSAFDHAS
jgi:hypothetical protein